MVHPVCAEQVFAEQHVHHILFHGVFQPDILAAGHLHSALIGKTESEAAVGHVAGNDFNNVFYISLTSINNLPSEGVVQFHLAAARTPQFPQQTLEVRCPVNDFLHL